MYILQILKVNYEISNLYIVRYLDRSSPNHEVFTRHISKIREVFVT